MIKDQVEKYLGKINEEWFEDRYMYFTSHRHYQSYSKCWRVQGELQTFNDDEDRLIPIEETISYVRFCWSSYTIEHYSQQLELTSEESKFELNSGLSLFDALSHLIRKGLEEIVITQEKREYLLSWFHEVHDWKTRNSIPKFKADLEGIVNEGFNHLSNAFRMVSISFYQPPVEGMDSIRFNLNEKQLVTFLVHLQEKGVINENHEMLKAFAQRHFLYNKYKTEFKPVDPLNKKYSEFKQEYTPKSKILDEIKKHFNIFN